jgi:hypothetical protein
MEPMQSLQELCIRLTDGHLPAHEEQGERIATALERIAEMMAHPLQAVQCSKETTTPKRVRNEAACCGNCPYYAEYDGKTNGDCGQHPPSNVNFFPHVTRISWCGDHPDFFRE